MEAIMDPDDDEDVEYRKPDLTKSEDEQLAELHAALEDLLEEEKARDALCEPQETEEPADSPMAVDLKSKPLDNQPFEPPYPAPIRRKSDTEDLLNGLIAECHFLMRAVVLPSTLAPEARVRRDFLTSAMELARTGARSEERRVG